MMLGRYSLDQPMGLGLTNTQIASRVRWGGISVAGIALAIAGLVFVWPAVRGYRTYRKGKRIYRKIRRRK